MPGRRWPPPAPAALPPDPAVPGRASRALPAPVRRRLQGGGARAGTTLRTGAGPRRQFPQPRGRLLAGVLGHAGRPAGATGSAAPGPGTGIGARAQGPAARTAPHSGARRLAAMAGDGAGRTAVLAGARVQPAAERYGAAVRLRGVGCPPAGEAYATGPAG